MLDRCNAGPEPEPGEDLAFWLLCCDMLDYQAEHRDGWTSAAARPGSVGFFVRRLRRAARRERRGWTVRRDRQAAEGSTC